VDSQRLELIRPSVTSRVATGIGGVLELVLALALLVILPGPARLAGLLFAFLAGDFLAASVRRGIWASDGAIELQTVVSLTRVPFEDIVCLHLAPHASGVTIQTATRAISMGEGSGASKAAIETSRGSVLELGERFDFEVREHPDVRSYVGATRGSIPAGWSLGGLWRAATHPVVWLTVLLYALVAVPVVLVTS